MSNGVNFRKLALDLRDQLDRVTAERDAALGREDELIDQLDAALRQVKANWDFAQDKQQRLTAADERWDRLESLTNDDLIAVARNAALNSVHRYNYMPALAEEAYKWEPHYWVIEAMRAALKPAEGGGDE